MADRLAVTGASPVGHVVALPGAATAPVRQPRGGAIGAYRKAHPWPGTWNEQPTPAPDPRKLLTKAEAIGGTWLGAEGEWYDTLRASIARDAERLGVPAPAARRW